MEHLSWVPALGFLIGARHAIEPDHIAVISTIVSGEREHRNSARIGLAWGIGHASAVLLAGGVLLALRLEFPRSLSFMVELCVGLVLIAAGAVSLRRALREGREGPLQFHSHGRAVSHVHPALSAHVHVGRFALAGRPLALGLLHGLAGTGALSAMMLAAMPTPGTALLYLVLFGAGSIAGMTLLTGALGVSLQKLAREERGRRAVQAATGVLSLVVGLVCMWVWVTAWVG